MLLVPATSLRIEYTARYFSLANASVANVKIFAGKWHRQVVVHGAWREILRALGKGRFAGRSPIGHAEYLYAHIDPLKGPVLRPLLLPPEMSIVVLRKYTDWLVAVTKSDYPTGSS